MGNPIKLTKEQEQLREKLKEINSKLWRIIRKETDNISYSEQQKMLKEMAEIAHELHMSLKRSGHEPRHHKYMLENRGVPVDDVEFYEHIHPVDDLLKFIDDENANDDPEDTTLGKEFKIRIYTRRWGHYDHFKLKRTETGWDYHGLFVYGDSKCDKQGFPELYESLDHEGVCYPKHLGDFLEYLWQQASDGLSEDEVQNCLNDIGEWISICEMNTPGGSLGGLR